MISHRISKEEYFQRLSTPYDPPSSDISDDAFLEKEYDPVCSAVLSTLARFGARESGDGTGDYFWDFGWGRTRGFGVEILNEAIVTNQLISALQQALHASNPRWEIHLRSGEFDFGLFVSTTAASHWSQHGLLVQLDKK